MLRTRLVLGLLCLLLILLAMGLYSIDRCSDLGRRIQVILKENDATLHTVQELKRNCTQMTSSLLAGTTGISPDSRAEFSEACRHFEAALEQQEAISKSGKERSLTRQLREIHTAYLQDAWKLLDKKPPSASKLKELTARVGKQTTQMLMLADDILEASRVSINARNAASGKETTDTIRLLMFAMTAAVVIAIYTSIRLSRSVLAPIASLTESIRQLGEGDLDQTVTFHSKDELGKLAATFNKMASQLRGFRNANSEKLQRLHLTVEKTIASFPDPIFVLNAAGNVEFRNPAGDMLAVKLLFSGMRRLPEQVEKLVEQSFATGEDYLPTLFKQAVMLRLDQTDHYFLPRVVLLRDEHQLPFGTAVILEDITRMRLVDQIKDNLVSTVSHELKTPLTSVRMALYLLLEKGLGPLTPKQEEMLSTAREDSDRLLNMLNDLLDLARLEEGPPELKLEAISPARLFEIARRETSGVAQEANITVIDETDPKLPEIQVDGERMGFVFNNLVSNAIKYSPQGSTIRLIATRHESDFIRFSVRDQGPGIPPEHQARIFEKFYRIAGSRKRGAGLGLSIAREIVRAHGGEIGVHSKPGEGSEFYVILPISATVTSNSPAEGASS
ncbi:MAG: hypothetical protein B9S32_10125 [Verrucomicrobia bacterium Tous-C9LFEB]|nr:MAG: hypothetical protein B9S32_10125 [Verrucomicrobia bacterium Tous-C9LFEB]